MRHTKRAKVTARLFYLRPLSIELGWLFVYLPQRQLARATVDVQTAPGLHSPHHHHHHIEHPIMNFNSESSLWSEARLDNRPIYL